MRTLERVILAIGIVIVDWAIFFVPLAAVFLAYVILTNPKWFRDYLDALSGSRPRAGGE